jgi:hypothetical protein
MKPALLTLMILASILGLAQRSNQIFYAQLMTVFSDAEKNFDFLKGELKYAEDKDSVFATNMTLEGTKENSILLSSGLSTYQALINDSTSEEGAQYILNSWKEKLTNVLTGGFNDLEKDFVSQKDSGTNGYQYSSDKISLYLLRHKEGNSYWNDLVIRRK